MEEIKNFSICISVSFGCYGESLYFWEGEGGGAMGTRLCLLTTLKYICYSLVSSILSYSASPEATRIQCLICIRDPVRFSCRQSNLYQNVKLF